MTLALFALALIVVGLFGFLLGALIAGRVADDRVQIRDALIASLAAEVGSTTANQLAALHGLYPEADDDDRLDIQDWLSEVMGPRRDETPTPKRDDDGEE